ncbi:MAG TPA: deoxyribose-phosphate aldolase, partial [Zunongwangia profunda]|nr:deoxyribose-phosphate aldolase [Zunongwangia profunda]
QLPYGLNGDAVNKNLLGKDSIKGKEYYEIKVTFNQDGGGTDYEDEYLYWINTSTFTVDYLAYSYHVNAGGIRFRAAFNPRIVNGLRFVDYKNYAEDDLSTPLENLDALYEAGKLKLFSEIITEDVKVNISE